MSKPATSIILTPADQHELESWVRASTTEQRRVLRARIVLAAASGDSTTDIARALHVRTATVSKWRIRFAQHGMAGLTDKPRPGKPATYDADTARRILAQLDQPPPAGYATWNGKLVAQALGNVSKHQVWRVLRQHGINLQRRRSWCISTDPEFAAKAADVVGLYLQPPEGALVICVDEKPQIQALERAQGWLKLPNGKAVTGFAHEYKRHGTTTLFAALETATGLVQVGHYQRKRRREFLDFMNEVVAAYPERELHVVLDNFCTHKPKCDRWLSRHRQVHFHFIPTHASWMNLVEVWFSILWRQSLRGQSCTSPQQVRRIIDRFVEVYNQQAAPFEWTKAEVHPSAPKKYYAELCK